MALPGLYGGDRIMVGARFLSHLHPGWWREGALLPASPTALDMADPYRCVLAWWAFQHLPAPAQRGTRQVTPYDRAMLALSLSSQQAQALGFTGVDADRLTPGWRHLITYLRASYEGGAAVDPANFRIRNGYRRHGPKPAFVSAWLSRDFGRQHVACPWRPGGVRE